MDRYEEALERAKEWEREHPNGYVIRDMMEFIFPGYNDSEDEMIRKELIQYLRDYPNLPNSQHTKADFFAYLEKKKDASKAIEAVERIDKYIDAHTANAHDMDNSNPDKKYYQGQDDAFGKIAGILQDVYSGEKQKGQKPYEPKNWPVDKDNLTQEQKHKFKVGDRVTNGECVYTINKIGKDCYWVKEHDCATIPFEYEDTWSIEQKPTSTVKSKFKSGDSIRFNGFGSNEYTIQLVGNGYYVNSEGGRMDMSYTDANFVLVENAQKDQKPIFKKGDRVIWDGEEFNILDVDKDTYNVGGYIVPFSREGELHPIGWKPGEWSEEDEKIAKEIEEELWYPGDFPDYPSKEESELYDGCQRRLNWFKNKFKSLRNRPTKSDTWKPSEEQMGALENARYMMSQSGDYYDTMQILDSLINDIKKL